MFHLNKSNLALKHHTEALQVVEPETDTLTPFQAYKIGILYPDTWHIFVNPSKSFSFHDGFAKIDRSASKQCIDQASLAIRWAKLKQEITIDQYMEEIKIQYTEKQKKNKRDRFKILSITPAEGLPHKAYLMTTSIHANHSVYRSIGKEEQILSSQLTMYCNDTNRLVIASIASTPEDFEKKSDLYKEILFSLSCH